MKIVGIIPYRVWRHKVTGKTASIYGANPIPLDAYEVVTAGFTTENDNGTVGVGRKPFETREQGEAYAKAFNACDWDGCRRALAA